MPNVPIPNHPLIGVERVFRYWLPAYDPDTDREPGVLILAPGMTVKIRAVYSDWNGESGLEMLRVWVHATSSATHVTPRDLGLAPLSFNTAGVSEPWTLGLSDCVWYDEPQGYRPWWAKGDCAGPRVGSTEHGILCEHHFNAIPRPEISPDASISGPA